MIKLKNSIFLYLFLTIVLISCSADQDPTSDQTSSPSTPLFESVLSEESGLDFNNVVTESEDFNVLTYRNFYNGGGVAIGDVNNDSLPDIYFTANMQPNKLYLNRGNLVFEDVTKQAGVEGTRSWSTGVTMTDVNGDGWLDIYVCNSGDIAGDNKQNELFINTGKLDGPNKLPSFVEKANEYNLSDEGFSTHASFFDYDLDGDLDCYILNNSFKDPDKIEVNISTRSDRDRLGGDKLLRNDGDKFTDVTLEAGIYNSVIGFGLGVSVSDLNGDMLPDIYISNDFWERDYLYINKGDGSFSEELTTRISNCSVSTMGSDIADLNNDGTYEIFTTDMLAADNYRLKAMTVFDPYHLEDLKYRSSFHYQILQNSLQLNDGNANFQEIAQFSGVAATDWSWGALVFDFDNDGWKDIFVSNGIYKDIMYLDFTNFINDEEEVKKVVQEKGEFDWRDFSDFMPSNPLSNFAFINNGNLTFRSAASELGLGQPIFSNGSSYGDLDLDGDLDLVINNVNTPASLYRNTTESSRNHNYLSITFKGRGKNPFGIGAEIEIIADNKKQVYQHYLSRGFQSSVQPGLVLGLGDSKIIDELTVRWPDKTTQKLKNIPSNQQLTLEQKNATNPIEEEVKTSKPLFKNVTDQLLVGDHIHKENRYNDFDHEPLLPRMLSTEGPKIVQGDVNQDGLNDLIFLGAADDPDKLFIQQSDGTLQQTIVADFEIDKTLESTTGALFDADGDGDKDLLIGAGGNEYQKGVHNFLLRYYENDGNGHFTKDIERTPPAAGNFSTILEEDFNQDGRDDLFIGGRTVPGNYGLPPRSFLFRSDNLAQWAEVIPAGMAAFGMITDGEWSDVDKDGFKDLVLVGEWMPIMILKTDGQKIVDRKVIQGSFGWWNSIEKCDLDNDGDDDFVLGNWGLNTKFKASSTKPLTMYVKDFDNNQKSEFIINWFAPLDNKSYPFASKMDISEQLPHLKKSILKYDDYANMTYETLFSEEEKANALTYVAEYLQSAILWNDEGSFRLEALPKEAQISPVFGIVADDLNNDGNKDIWLGGNFYGLQPQVGRHDSSRGVLLLGDGKKGFEYVSPLESGINVTGEVRDASLLNIGGEPHLVIARNNASALVYTLN